MPDIVCVDTHILIWGIKKEASQGQEQMIQLANDFLQSLDKEKVITIVPSVVIGELLLRIFPENHDEFISQFSQDFLVAPYDILAASFSAKVWQKNKTEGTIENIRNENTSVNREIIKIDCQIIGIALAQKANCIYSYDPHIIKLATDFIETKSISENNQLELDI